MAKAYLQPSLFFDDARVGTLTVYVAGGTTKATLYNPTSGAPISNPVGIDADGYAASFMADTGVAFDLVAKDYLGATKATIPNVMAGVSSSVALGETSTTAYRGDRGKAAYDHSQEIGNPHETEIENINGLDDALTGKAPITSTLTNEPGQDVLPTGTYSVSVILQWFRNNLSQLFSLVSSINANYVSKIATGLQAIASALNGPSVFAIGVNTNAGSDNGRLDLFGAGANTTARGAGIQIQGKDRGGTNAGGGIYHDTANITSASAAHIFRIKGVTKAAISNDGATRVFALDALAGSDTTPLAANAQTQLNDRYTKAESNILYTKNTDDEIVTGSWAFTETPSVPNQPPESVGSGAANAQFVADTTYPTWEGSAITSGGTIALQHGQIRVITADNLTLTLSTAPDAGTVSWLYYTPVSCSTGSLTLSFFDAIGTSRTFSKSSTAGASHLPQLIKCTKTPWGWALQWETEA